MNGKYIYTTKTGIQKGNFNVHQGKAGAIYLTMGTNKIALTLKQLNDLAIPVHDFFEFNEADFYKYYNIQKSSLV